MSKEGFQNEDDIKDIINKNPFSQLPNDLQHFLCFIFNRNFSSTDKFTALKPTVKLTKTDLIICYNGISKNISVKIGSGNSVHQEKFSEFLDFLQENSFTKECINDLKLFHYGDGTNDDTGKKRFDANECKKKYCNEINRLNKVFNNKAFLIKLLDRFLFKGNISEGKPVEFVYYGSDKVGIWAGRDEIIEYFTENSFSNNTVHIASLTYQVWGRNPDFKAKHPNRRYVMQIKWGQLEKDLKIIESKRKKSNE